MRSTPPRERDETESVEAIGNRLLRRDDIVGQLADRERGAVGGNGLDRSAPVTSASALATWSRWFSAHNAVSASESINALRSFG